MGGNFTSMQSYVEATDTYNNVVVTTPLTRGQGFWAFVGSATFLTSPFNLINSGTISQGTVGIALTAGGAGLGYNLVANPYPSPISWTKLFNLNAATLNSEVQVWSPEGGGQYGTYIAGQPSGTNGQTDIIPAGQGFYVLANAGMTLIFNESVKSTSNTVAHLRSGKSSNQEISINLIGSAGDHDETLIRLSSDATATFDAGRDARKLYAFPVGPEKFTVLSTKGQDGLDYAINTMPSSALGQNIPLNTRYKNTGTYAISAEGPEAAGSCIILHDKAENRIHDLAKGAYEFTISDGATAEDRFELSICESVATSVSELKGDDQLFIGRDGAGTFVRTSFDQPTKATIAAFNIVGQQIMKDVTVEGTNTYTHLDLEAKNQLVIIRVSTAAGTVVKKIIY
jgi:hypothetical protein